MDLWRRAMGVVMLGGRGGDAWSLVLHAGDGEGKHEHERECARRDQILYSAPTLPSSPRELPTGVAGALATQAGFIDA